MGPLDASLVVVGEAPAAGDPDADRWRGGNHTGMAYTSRRSGRKIRDLVADLGFESDAYYTNAVKCFPADCGDSEKTGRSVEGAEPGDRAESDDQSRPDNREPTADERANCRPYLVGEIGSVEPVAVLATGKHATASVLAVEGADLDGFLDAVLGPVVCERLETTLVPLLHPSYQEVWISRLGYTREEYVAAIRETLADIAECRGPSDAGRDGETPSG